MVVDTGLRAAPLAFSPDPDSENSSDMNLLPNPSVESIG